jgi:hypothetical protein
MKASPVAPSKLVRVTCLTLMVSALGCKTASGNGAGSSSAGSSSARISDPAVRKEYEDLVALGDRAEANPQSADAVLVYADALANAPERLIYSINRQERMARAGKAATMMNGVLPGLTGPRRAAALDTQGILLLAARGSFSLAEVRGKFREAYAIEPSWRSCTLLADALDPGADGEEARTLCGACYEVGQKESVAEPMIFKLLDVCVRYAPAGKEPAEVMTAIPTETWSAYGKMTRARKEERVRREELAAERERRWDEARAAEAALGPACLYDNYSHRNRFCTGRDTRGECSQYGADCNPHASGPRGNPNCLYDSYSHRNRLCTARDTRGECAQFGADCNPG